MKKQTIAFVVVILVALTIVPSINLLSGSKQGTSHHFLPSALFNLDFASSRVSRWLYPTGISIDPGNVIIGHDGWLYLGDNYASTRTAARQGLQDTDNKIIKKISTAVAGWDKWLSNKGVQLYRVMLIPDKGTVYPEYLPDWAKPAKSSKTDALIAEVGKKQYVDLRPGLIKAKALHSEALYYQTDTHWNLLGAWVGFSAFAEVVSPYAPDLRWPTSNNVRLVNMTKRQDGDLSQFLRLNKVLSDPDPELKIFLDKQIITTQYNFDTGELIKSGGNLVIEISPQHPIQVISENALNIKKVLWVRDSFGDAQAPFMSATFSETIHLHWDSALKNERFAELVESWRPDYVFATVVERNSRSALFTILPP